MSEIETPVVPTFSEANSQRLALVSEYDGLCAQLAGVPATYARLEALKGEIAATEPAILAAAASEKIQLAGFPALQTPVDVRPHEVKVKESSVRTARLQWMLDNQGAEGISVHAPEGEVSAFETMIKETSRDGGGDAYGIASGFVRSEYCTDNGARGISDRRFFVNVADENVRAWLGLDS